MANFKAFLLLGLVLAHVVLVISSEVSARELEETEAANGEQLDRHGHGHGHEHRHLHRHDHEHHGKPGHGHPGHGAVGGGA
ncbi:hypothetical protein CJ030_MR2G028953 [Morella rubra]|uniref:Phase-change related protein n=1 Tax=Morella rubra TaxID=262757 RepID=A0A6A1WI80_9ROSI|nr:hypothetical protein CJ030_MR2G028953 [Morella rubra]